MMKKIKELFFIYFILGTISLCLNSEASAPAKVSRFTQFKNHIRFNRFACNESLKRAIESMNKGNHPNCWETALSNLKEISGATSHKSGIDRKFVSEVMRAKKSYHNFEKYAQDLLENALELKNKGVSPSLRAESLIKVDEESMPFIDLYKFLEAIYDFLDLKDHMYQEVDHVQYFLLEFPARDPAPIDEILVQGAETQRAKVKEKMEGFEREINKLREPKLNNDLNGKLNDLKQEVGKFERLATQLTQEILQKNSSQRR